ncbi:potassium channel family protein [Planctomycetota bacterium]
MLSKEGLTTMASSSMLFLASFTVFGIPFLPKGLHPPFYVYSFIAIFLAAVFSSERHRRPIFGFAVVLIILEIVTDRIDNGWLNHICSVMILGFFFLAIYFLLNQIVRQHRVTPRVILEAINGYLLLGICFSVLVAIAMRDDANAFSLPAEEVGMVSYNSVYYAFVTMSTLGYGEIVPLTPGTKALAMLICVTGQLYLTVVIALLVGKYIGYWSAREMRKQ